MGIFSASTCAGSRGGGVMDNTSRFASRMDTRIFTTVKYSSNVGMITFQPGLSVSRASVHLFKVAISTLKIIGIVSDQHLLRGIVVDNLVGMETVSL